MKALDNNKKNFWLQILSGSITAVSITLVLILIFALIIRFTNIPDKFIMPINQVIKIISLLISIVITFKKHKEKGFAKGFFIGLLYSILAFLVFSILSGKFSFYPNTIIDICFSSIIGGICGIIAVNIGKHNT